MSHLTLVRHAQASFFAAEYDLLSQRGETQACLLGDFWVRSGIRFDEVCTGPRARQRRTAELIGDRFRHGGIPYPQAESLAELDEYDLDGLFHHLAPALAESDVPFRELAERFRGSVEEADRLKTFQRMFEHLLGHWQDADLDGMAIEAWPAFRDRVSRSLRRIREKPGRGRRVLVVTSGGFIGTAVQQALGAPDKVALEMGWRLRNGSVTEFVFSQDRINLDSFNGVPHLPDTSMWTYR